MSEVVENVSKVVWSTVRELQARGVLLVEDGNHGEQRPRSDEFVQVGIAFIRAADLSGGVVDFKGSEKINQTARQRITKGIGAPGDVLLSHKGTVGKLAVAPISAPAFVCSPQTTFWRVLNETVVNRKYLYAFMLSQNFRDQLARTAGETDMAPYVSLTNQRQLEIPVLPIALQISIGEIVSALDDKIAVNRATNQTLEQIAQALFQSWFVDFDPVRAKAEGRKPDGMDDETAALFPDSFEGTELGMVPKGWGVRRLDDLVELNYGKALRSEDRSEGRVPVYGSGGITGFHSTSLVEGPGIVIGRKGSVGTLYWVDVPFFPIDTVYYVSTKQGTSLEYAYYLLQTLGLETMNTDAAVPGLNRNNAYRLTVPAAPIQIMERFTRGVRSLRAQISAGSLESQTLSRIRDSLLPRLLSGQIDLTRAML